MNETKKIIVASVLPLLASGCAEPEYILGTSTTGGEFPAQTGTTNEAVDETGSADTMALDVPGDGDLPSFGEWWCVRAEGAEYTPEPDLDPINDPPVVHPDGSAPEGCQCVPFNTDVHQWILDNEMGDSVTIEQMALQADPGVGLMLEQELLALRDAVYTNAVETCVDLVPASSTGNTCGDPSLFDVDATTLEFEPRPLYRGNRAGEVECLPPPEGILPSCDFAEHTEDISETEGSYEISGYIVERFLQEPHCLMAQGWRVWLNPSGEPELAGVTPTDMLAELGLENGDRFVSAVAADHRFVFQDPLQVLEAYRALRTETEFALEIEREGLTVVLSYRIR